MKRLAWGLVMIVGAALAANGFMAWRVNWRLASLKSAIRSAGDPASIAELAPAPIPDGANAAAQIESLGAALKSFEADYVHFLERTPEGKAFDAASDAGALPTAEQAAAMQAILDRHAAIGAGILRAAACDQWASQGDFSAGHTAFLDQLLDRIQQFRGASRYANWQIEVLASEGKIDEAATLGTQLLKLARLHEREPTLVSYLVSAAVRGAAVQRVYDALAAGRASPDVRAALDRELALTDDPRAFSDVLRTERAAALDAMGPMFQGSSRPAMWLIGWSATQHFLGSYELLNDVIAAAQKPWVDFRKEAQPGGLFKIGHYGAVAGALQPALIAAIEARDRDVAQIRALRVFNALQRFTEENGREATGVDELGLGEDATRDPVTGLPLVLKLTERGWAVYSVGKNGADDGGDMEKQLDVGVGPKGEAE